MIFQFGNISSRMSYRQIVACILIDFSRNIAMKYVANCLIKSPEFKSVVWG